MNIKLHSLSNERPLQLSHCLNRWLVLDVDLTKATFSFNETGKGGGLFFLHHKHNVLIAREPISRVIRNRSKKGFVFLVTLVMVSFGAVFVWASNISSFNIAKSTVSFITALNLFIDSVIFELVKTLEAPVEAFDMISESDPILFEVFCCQLPKFLL